MLAIARRHFDSIDRANVEARFVVQQDDVRPLAGGRARLVVRELEPFGHFGVGFQIALGRQDVHGLDAGAHEDGDVVVVGEDLAVGQRECKRHRHQGREACRGADCRDPPPDAPGIDPPKQHEQRDRDHGRNDPDDANLRQYRPQERHGLGIDDHHVHEIRGHPEDMMLEPRNPDHRREHR